MKKITIAIDGHSSCGKSTMAKALAKECGLNDLQLSVERSNEASVKTILKNGGVYERTFDFENQPADVYRITL